MSSNYVLTDVHEYVGSFKQCECYCKPHGLKSTAV